MRSRTLGTWQSASVRLASKRSPHAGPIKADHVHRYRKDDGGEKNVAKEKRKVGPGHIFRRQAIEKIKCRMNLRQITTDEEMGRKNERNPQRQLTLWHVRLKLG